MLDDLVPGLDLVLKCLFLSLNALLDNGLLSIQVVLLVLDDCTHFCVDLLLLELEGLGLLLEGLEALGGLRGKGEELGLEGGNLARQGVDL